MKRFNSVCGIAVGCFSAISMLGSAAAFDTGTGGGTVTVPTDYGTLKAAADAFNALSGGIQGDWTIQISTSTLTEPANMTFGNATNGKSLTIKPGTGFQPVVSFTQSADNSGASGHVLFGPTTLAAATYPSMTNITVDGSNNGTNTRDMTWQEPAGINGVNSRIIRVRGDVNGFTCKNMSLLNFNTVNQAHGIEFSTQGAAVPKNLVVDNCNIQAGTASSSTGVQTSSGSAPSAGLSLTPITVKNSIVRGGTRGIFLNLIGDATIQDNTASANINNAGFISEGIFDFAVATGITGWTHTIQRNKIDLVQNIANTTSTGAMGIYMAAVGPGTENVFNNSVAGNTLNSTPLNGAVTIVNRGIYVESASPTYTIANNSVNLNAQTSYTALLTANADYGIGSSQTHTAGAPLTIKNNIVRINETTGTAAVYLANSANVVLDYNDYSVASGILGRVGSTEYPTLAGWQTATTQDAHSLTANPVPLWTSATDLHFTSNPGNGYAGTPVAGVTVDIDNQTRSVTVPYKGSDERPETLAAAVQHWSLY